MQKTLVLDAMGVIYKAADDVAELLVPFVRSKNQSCNVAAIDDLYSRASLGELTAAEFWRSVGVDQSLEDEYLLRHELAEGLLEFLPIACERFERILCLSNDVSEWSIKLRKRFGLEQFVSGWFISGDMGVRKPSIEIYNRMLKKTGLRPDDMVFVDDRLCNLDAAKCLGIVTILYDVTGRGTAAGCPAAGNLLDVLECA